MKVRGACKTPALRNWRIRHSGPSRGNSIQPPWKASASARGIAIAMYCVLLVSYMLMAADRYLFPVLAPDIRKAFGFSLANTGLLSTIFTLGLGLGGLPTGYLLARYSRKMVLLTGIVIFSAATALTTVVPGFWTMLVCLAAQGIGMSMLATSMFALAASYFSGYRVRRHRLRQFLLRHRRISRPVPRRKTSPVLRHLACADDLVSARSVS